MTTFPKSFLDDGDNDWMVQLGFGQMRERSGGQRAKLPVCGWSALCVFGGGGGGTCSIVGGHPGRHHLLGLTSPTFLYLGEFKLAIYRRPPLSKHLPKMPFNDAILNSG